MDKKILNHFKKSDPLLFAAYTKLGALDVLKTRIPKEYFAAICAEIISQQLSGRVADVIYERFKKLFPKGNITPKNVLKLKHEDLRSTGMSNAKARFLKDLAEKVDKKELVLGELDKLNNEEVIAELIKVKGIGRWTAEMFLIFSLGRPDVFSHGDLGLNKAIKLIYGLDTATVEDIEKIVSKWSPYKSFACRILWRSLD